MFVDILFNKKYRILVQICIFLKNTLQRSHWKNFQVAVETIEVEFCDDNSAKKLASCRYQAVERVWTIYAFVRIQYQSLTHKRTDRRMGLLP